jgi:hypothetical protein
MSAPHCQVTLQHEFFDAIDRDTGEEFQTCYYCYIRRPVCAHTWGPWPATPQLDWCTKCHEGRPAARKP